MRKVALVSSFCDTQEKIDVLDKNLDIIKSLGVDVLVISPFYLPKSTIDKCDYFFVTKDNPVLDWPEKAMFYWRIISDGLSTYRISTTIPDYGYAGLHQIKQLADISLSLDYEQYFITIYDLKIDDNVIDGFKSSKTCSVYPSKRGETFWDVGLHFMILNKNSLFNFKSLISKENYVNSSNSDVFQWLKNIQPNVGYVVEQNPVEDLVYYHETTDFMNYSEYVDFKIFIEKNDETKQTIKLLFYDVTSPTQLDVVIGGVKHKFDIDNQISIFDLGFTKFDVQDVHIVYKENILNLTEKIKKVKHNVLVKL